MNQIERLLADIKKHFPEADAEIDAPPDPRNPWFLICRRPGVTPITVEWRPDRGFGVSTPEPYDYGVGVDEVYPNAQTAYDRVASLIATGGRTTPPLAVRLSELRQALGISQAELADRMGVKQPSVAKMEVQDDIKLSTLARIVSALGATLSIRATLPDGSERELRLDA